MTAKVIFIDKKQKQKKFEKPNNQKPKTNKKQNKMSHGLVLGLVGLIDVKGIDVTQPICS